MSANGKVKTWAEVWTLYEQRCRTKRVNKLSMENYRRTAGRFAAWADEQGIVPADIEPLDMIRYTGSLQRQDGQPYAPGTLYTHCKDLKTLINFAADYKIIPERIKVEMPRLKEGDPQALNDEELKVVLDYFEGRAHLNPRDTAIVCLLLDTGLRSAELRALKWDDLIWNEARQQGTIHVDKQINRNREYVPVKNGRPRDVYFRARAWRYLLANKADLSGQVDFHNRRPWHAFPVNTETGPVFWAWPQVDKPDVLAHSGLAYMLRTAGDKIGIPLRPHIFRHTCGRMLTMAGVPAMAIKEILGHSSLKMVEHYSRLWGQDVENLYFEKMNGNGDSS